MKVGLFRPVSTFRSFFSKQKPKETQKIEIRTIPKSGTYLIREVLTNLGASFNFRHVSAKTEAFDHCIDSRVHHYKSDLYHTMSTGKNVIVLRDPRDNLISMASWFAKGSGNYQRILSNKAFKNWQTSTSYGEKLTEIISLNTQSPLYPRWYLQFHLFEKTCSKFLLEPKRFLIVRFEDLLSEEAGGNGVSRATETIEKIYHFYNMNSPEKSLIKDALLKSWGAKTHTYNSKVTKKVGQWKGKFSKEQITLFKKIWNPFLIKLGYESNENWG